MTPRSGGWRCRRQSASRRCPTCRRSPRPACRTRKPIPAVLVPAGTPRPVVDLLYREIKAIVALPEIKERFEVLGLDPVANTPEEFAEQIKVEMAKWSKVIHGANIKM